MRSLAAAVTCGTWLVLAVQAHATVVVPVDFAEMVEQSQSIVYGRVIDVTAQMSGSRRTIESLVTVSIVTALKGGGAASVVFRLPSGQVGRYRRITVGSPELAEGDEVVIFLKGRAPLLPMPFGLTQGVYRVARTAGQAIVTPLVADERGRSVRGDPARRSLTLEAFAQKVRSLVRPS